MRRNLPRATGATVASDSDVVSGGVAPGKTSVLVPFQEPASLCREIGMLTRTYLRMRAPRHGGTATPRGLYCERHSGSACFPPGGNTARRDGRGQLELVAEADSDLPRRLQLGQVETARVTEVGVGREE